jgi:hypothetical protein
MLGFGMAQGCFAIGFGQLLKSSKVSWGAKVMFVVYHAVLMLACSPPVSGSRFHDGSRRDDGPGVQHRERNQLQSRASLQLV